MRVLGYGTGDGTVVIDGEVFQVRLGEEYGQWVIACDEKQQLVFSVTNPKYGDSRKAAWSVWSNDGDFKSLKIANAWPPISIPMDYMMASDYEAEAEAFESLS